MMATSGYQDTVFVLKFLQYIEPNSILDIGAGFGRWGYLCRCHLDDGCDLQVKENGRIKIDSVEAFADNVSPMYKSIYDKTYIGDACEVVPGLGRYDVVICSHMIEHLEKEQGHALIQEMLKHARKAVVIGLPFNDPLRGAVDGNEFEAHRSIWKKEDLDGYDARIQTFPFVKGTTLGLVLLPVSDEARWAAKTMTNSLLALLSRVKGCFFRKR